jgi:hypothetical protein
LFFKNVYDNSPECRILIYCYSLECSEYVVCFLPDVCYWQKSNTLGEEETTCSSLTPNSLTVKDNSYYSCLSLQRQLPATIWASVRQLNPLFYAPISEHMAALGKRKRSFCNPFFRSCTIIVITNPTGCVMLARRAYISGGLVGDLVKN